MTVLEIQAEITKNLNALTPRQISDYTVMLAVHLSTIGEALASAEMKYYEQWQFIRVVADTDGFADKKAKSTVEHYRKRVIELEFKAVKEQINALKKRLEVLSAESQNRY